MTIAEITMQINELKASELHHTRTYKNLISKRSRMRKSEWNAKSRKEQTREVNDAVKFFAELKAMIAKTDERINS